MRPPVSGELLASATGLGAGFFNQAIILLLDCDDDGALGVAINKISAMQLDDVLPQWVPLASPPGDLFAGGPVSPNGAICLAKVANPREEPPGWRRIVRDIGLLHLDTPVELAAGAFSDLRIFAGYSGWAAGQLEAELEKGWWLRLSARDDDIFTGEPAGLWRRVLRRQGGEVGLLSTWVAQPEFN